MLEIQYGRRFKKEFRNAVKQPGHTPQMLKDAVDFLVRQEPLPESYCDHKLRGKYKGYRECHLAPDWLLVYKVEREKLLLVLARTGSHSDLF